MPQMAPMWWLPLFMFFISLLFMFMTVIYSSCSYSKSLLLKNFIINQMNWKW